VIRELPEVVGDSDGSDGGRETVGRETGPALVLKVGAKIQVGEDAVVCACSESVHVVGDICDAVLVVEDSAPEHSFGIGSESAIVTVIPYACLVCFFVKAGWSRVVEKAKFNLCSEMRGEVKVCVGGDSFEFFRGIVRVGQTITDADLEIPEA
jgi:hypothetical protein